MQIAISLILAQALVTVLATLGFGLDTLTAGLSALVGGVIGMVSTAFQAHALFAPAASAEAFYRSALRMEVRKWVLMACLFALVFGLWQDCRPGPLLATFALGQLCYLGIGFTQKSRLRQRAERH